MAFHRFRVEDLKLSTFNEKQKAQIKKFQEFIMQKPDGHCCICMKILYPEERKWRNIQLPNNLPCIEWKIEPLKKADGRYMVCSQHQKTPEGDILRFVYPGTVIVSL